MAFEPDEGDDTLAVSGPDDEVRQFLAFFSKFFMKILGTLYFYKHF